MSSFIEAVVRAGSDYQTVEIQYGQPDQFGDLPYRLNFPRRLLYILSKTYHNQATQGQRNVFILSGVPPWSLNHVVWWMQGCVREANFPLLAVPVHDAQFEDIRLLANFMDVTVLKAQLNQRMETYRRGYYSIDDIRVSYIVLQEDDELQIQVAQNIASALSDGLIKRTRPYHSIRTIVPQLNNDINHWFEEHRDEIHAKKSARAEEKWKATTETIK